MTRFVTRPSIKTRSRTSRPRQDDDYDYYEPPLTLTHLEVDDAAFTPTGLYDRHGNEIYRTSDPIGFHNPLDDE